MRKMHAALGSALFLVAAPGVLAGLLPWWLTHWQLKSPFLGFEQTRALGVLLILAGVLVLLGSFARFALQGLGTPAPIAPPRHLVVTGLYRFVRNPMYLAVFAIILGQALVLGDWRLVVYAMVVWLACHLFVVSYEEPTLRRTFGAEYRAFRANVPRWLPRGSPWRAD